MLAVLESNSIFRGLQRSFFTVLPLILFGTFALTIRHFPSTAVLLLFDHVLGERWKIFFDSIISGTLGIISLALICTFSHSMTLINNQKKNGPYISPILAVVVVMSCFFILSAPCANNSWEIVFSSGSGLLPALMVAIAGTTIFHYLSRFKISRWSLDPIGHDPFVRDVLTALPAGIATILLATLFRVSIEWLGITNFHSAVVNVAFIPFKNMENGLGFGLGYTAISQALWSLGAHGQNLLFGVEDNILIPAVYANQAAIAKGIEPELIFTKTFFDLYTRMGGSGATICLILSMLIKSRNRGAKKLCMFAIIPGLCNVNEPLLFGIPIVLNPIYVIPFILTPILQTLIAYGATVTGIIPYTSEPITWTTPVFISGFASTGDIWGPIVQAVNVLTGTACYTPFVTLADRLRERRGEVMIEKLKKAATSSELKSKGISILDIPGETGRFARALAADLTVAMGKNTQLYLVYQPQVLERNRFLSGVEALLRWEHPIYGNISPEVIVALAEETGNLDQIGFLVLDKALRQRAAWKEIADDCLTVSVNVVPRQLTDSSFSRKVFNILNENSLPPSILEIEITESSILEPNKETIKTLETLNKGGIRIAIDDFGMGHSSLRYLRAFPISTIKIDRSLTIGDTREIRINKHIVKSVLALSKNLDISTIVEGVETHEQLDHFRDIGYMNFQGYLFSRPLTSEQCTDFILGSKKQTQTGN